jgi:hypothetical protein
VLMHNPALAANPDGHPAGHPALAAVAFVSLVQQGNALGQRDAALSFMRPWLRHRRDP